MHANENDLHRRMSQGVQGDILEFPFRDLLGVQDMQAVIVVGRVSNPPEVDRATEHEDNQGQSKDGSPILLMPKPM